MVAEPVQEEAHTRYVCNTGHAERGTSEPIWPGHPCSVSASVNKRIDLRFILHLFVD